MVKTDRKIIISNGDTSLEITRPPFYVNTTEGFDNLDVATVTTQGFDQDGATIINSYINSRELRINGQIVADSNKQMSDLMQKLEVLFLPKKDIKINHYYGGLNRVLTARVTQTPIFGFTEVSRVRTWEVSLTSESDVWWSDDNPELVEMANVVGGFHFPLIIPIEEGGVTFGIKDTSLIANVYNASAITIGMTIKFIANGVLTNPQLFNVNTREFIKINCTMEAGEEIEITTGSSKTVTQILKGKRKNYINKIDIAGGGSTFLMLDPGDNLFRYAADAGESFLQCKVYFKNKYVGV